MTDTSSLAITHATTDYPPVRATRASPEVTDGASDSAAAEEDYTIKCVCRFEDDDGHTVFCERCDTWQHIICYYESKEDVPDVHNCVDCEPRYVDRRRAVHKQSEKRLEEKRRSVDPERKPRRPGNKANKRKSKDTDAHEPNLKRHDSTARDQPPAKKPKASHRSSTSTSGLASAPAQSRNRRPSTAVPVSPTTSDSRVPLYSNEFLHLYDRDHTFVEKDSNLLPGVSFVDEIISWLRDPEILARVTEGLSSEDFAQHCEAAFDSPWPTLRTHTYTDSSVDIDGKHPTFKILKTDDPIREGQIVGEIFGEVGHIDHYKANPSNRWKTLQHPEPFVYFSSQLPLYIDSRQEGNQLRYIRRSCNSNVSLKIYITNSREYHFCFVARRDIPANSEITVMWYLDPALIKDKKASKPKYKPGLEDNTVEEDLPALCFSNILADFGGCPCGRNQNCSLANLDRRSDAASNKATKTKGKAKAKSKSVASPMDPGRASTSRAGSESTKHVEDDDAMTDVRSTSGSVRDRVTHSRDVSPTDKQTLPGLSSRERRKIADAEMQFRRLEKGAPTTKGAVGTKRKKRVSGPSAQPTAASRSTQTGEPGAKQKHQPHSPTANSPRSVATDQHAPSRKSAARTVLPTSETIDRYKPSPYRRVGPYVDASTQLYENDVETEFWHLEHLRRGYRVGILPDSKMYLARFVAGSKMQGDREQQEKYTGDSSLIPSGVIPWWCNYFPFPLDDRTEYDLLPEDARLMGIPLDHGPLKLPLRWSFWQRKEPRRPTKFAGVTITGLPYPLIPPPDYIEESSAQGDITMQEASLHNELSNPLVPPPWPSAAAHTIKVLGADNHGSPRLSMPPPSASNIQSPSSPRPVSAGSYTTTANRDTASSHLPVPTPVSAPIATPAKKKLSLGDYLMRRETMANTPASDSPQAPERAPNSTPVWVTTTEHYLAITKLPDDWSEPRPRPLTPDARGDKNEPSDSQEVIMEDAPESAPTSTEPAPTNPPSISS